MALTTNPHVLKWIDESIALVKPDKVVWIDGSEEQLNELREQLLPAPHRRQRRCPCGRPYLHLLPQGRRRWPYQQLDGSQGSL